MTKLNGFTLDESDFTADSHTAGEQTAVLSAQVPKNRVWIVDVGAPIEVLLVHRQDFTVSSGATESKTLDPDAPRTPVLPSPVDGEYREEAELIAYDLSDDSLITDSTDVKYSGTFGTTEDFIQSVEFTETTSGGDQDIAVFTVQKFGLATLRKRSKSGVPGELQENAQIQHSFANPDAPDSDQAVRWDRLAGTERVIPPKFDLEVVYYDADHTVDVDDDLANNLSVRLPMKQRRVLPDEDPAELRRKIRRDMAE